MPRDINILPDAWTAMAGQDPTGLLTLQSMAFALVTNPSNREAALVYCQARSNTAPVAGAAIEFYLIRNTGTAGESDDNIADAGVANTATVIFDQADLLCAMVVSATASKFYRRIVDTWPLGPLGSGKWGIGIRNGTSTSLSGGGPPSDQQAKYMTYSRRATP